MMFNINSAFKIFRDERTRNQPTTTTSFFFSLTTILIKTKREIEIQ